MTQIAIFLLLIVAGPGASFLFVKGAESGNKFAHMAILGIFATILLVEFWVLAGELAS